MNGGSTRSRVRMLDPQTAALSPTQLGGQPQGRVVHGQLAFSNNGRWLAAGYIHPTELDEDTWFRVWDTGNLARPAAAFTLPLLVNGLAVSDDGTRIYAGTGEQVHTLDVAAGREIRSAPSAGDLALSPDGSTLAVVAGTADRLARPGTTDGEVGDRGGRRRRRAHVLADGRAAGLRGRRRHPGRAITSQIPTRSGIRLSPKRGPGGIGFSPDGRTLYSRGDDRLLMWDLVGDRRLVRSVPSRTATRLGQSRHDGLSGRADGGKPHRR